MLQYLTTPRPVATLYYLAIGLAVSAATPALGQSAGAFGARSIGGSFSPAASNFGGSAAARGGAGARGGVAGTGGSLAGATTRGDTSVGQITGNERFLRNNRQGQFVGADASDSNNFFSQLTSGLTANQGLRGQNNNNNGQNNRNNSAAQQVKARVQLSAGFPYAAPSGDAVSAALQRRLEVSPRIERRGPITVRLEGKTAVLSGLVATQHDRELAARVALLEVGVAEVRNELAVAPPETTAPQPHPPTTMPPAPRLP